MLNGIMDSGTMLKWHDKIDAFSNLCQSMEIKNEIENNNSVIDNGHHHEPHGENGHDPASNYSPHNFFFDLK